MISRFLNALSLNKYGDILVSVLIAIGLIVIVSILTTIFMIFPLIGIIFGYTLFSVFVFAFLVILVHIFREMLHDW